MNKFSNNAVLVLSVPELEALHTGSLLTRLQRLRELDEDAESSDWTAEELSAAEGRILFKSTEIWKQAYRDLKAILDSRGHLPRGSKHRRQQTAFQKKHR